MKKKIILGISVLASVLVLVVVCAIVHLQTKKNTPDNSYDDMDTYDKYISMAKTTFPLDIFVYGENCNFRNSVEYHEIEEITDEELATEKKHKLIIVNDLNGTAKLSDKDYDALYDYTFYKDYAFLYLGKNLQEEFVKRNFIIDCFEQRDRSFGIRKTSEGVVRDLGIWTDESQSMYDDDNRELLGESIFVIFIAHIFKGV